MRRARPGSIVTRTSIWIALPSFLGVGVGLLTATASADTTEPADTTAAPGQAKASEPPPRPQLPEAPASPSIPWERHIDVGGDVVFIQRPASTLASGDATTIRYAPAIGYGVHGRWDVFRYLRFSAYYVRAYHDVVLPAGALYPGGSVSLDDPIKTYSFGARLAPTMPWTPRARTWITGGVGWGRIEVGRMNVTDGTGAFFVRERAASFVEIPIGLGTSFDIIPRWLSIELELTGAFVLGQEGEALTNAQAIDASGKKRSIGAFPDLDATFVQTVGLSLIL